MSLQIQSMMRLDAEKIISANQAKKSMARKMGQSKMMELTKVNAKQEYFFQRNGLIKLYMMDAYIMYIYIIDIT